MKCHLCCLRVARLRRLVDQVLQMCKVSYKIIPYFYTYVPKDAASLHSGIDLFVCLSIFIDRRHARPFSSSTLLFIEDKTVFIV